MRLLSVISKTCRREQIQDSEVFGPEHSGRVRCLGAGALPSQVFVEKYKHSHCQGYDTISDATDKFEEMEEKIKKMEAREAEREARLQAEMEAREAQRQTSGQKMLPGQMADVMVEIMQQYMGIPSNAQESIRRPPPW